MKLSIKRFVYESMKELTVTGRLLLGLVIGIVPAVMVAGFIILHPDTEFYIKHVTNFYCMLGMLMAVLTSIYLISRDFSTGAITLISNSRYNRRSYVFANMIVAVLVAFIYAVIGVAVAVICSGMGVPGRLGFGFLSGFFLNVILIIPTYFMLCYIIFLKGAGNGTVYTLLTAALLFLPNLISNILPSIHSKLVRSLIENTPLYYYPIYVGSRALSLLQYAIGAAVLIIGFMYILNKSKRYK